MNESTFEAQFFILIKSAILNGYLTQQFRAAAEISILTLVIDPDAPKFTGTSNKGKGEEQPIPPEAHKRALANTVHASEEAENFARLVRADVMERVRELAQQRLLEKSKPHAGPAPG